MTETTKPRNLKRVVTGKVRVSYPWLTKPQPPVEGSTGDPKYSVTMLIPKGTPEGKATLAKLRAAEEAAQMDKFGKLAKGWASLIKDGDEADTDEHPEFAGMWMVTARSSSKVGCVDASRNIIDPDEVYPGCYARVSVSAYWYDAKVKKGVSFALNGVQFVSDGERFGGGGFSVSDFEDDFDDFANDDVAESLI